MMGVRHKMQRFVVFWPRKTTYTRTLSTFTNDFDDRILFLKSPPLVTLDTPDVWPPNFDSPQTHISPPCSEEKSGRIIDGKAIAEEIISGVGVEVRRMKKTIGEVPGLAVILVGERRDSQTYVRKKIEACEEVGINFALTELSDNCTEDEVCDVVSSFNTNPSYQGILVQLPLPQHLNEGKIMDLVRVEKDVDGFNPMHMGNLAMRGREPLFIPCTPKGCIELLIRSGVEIMGKKAVVIGRSNIVGLPASLLLQRHNATVSVVNALTRNPEEVTREADIVVTAVGVPNLVRGSWLKPGAVVVDVGTHPVEDPSHEHGYRLIGDVCYEEASKIASAITPVPGGVGPVTVAMLLCNTLHSAKRFYNFF